MLPQVFDQLFAAMDELDKVTTDYFLAAEKRHLATDRAEEWADNFDRIRADLARARDYMAAYHAQWLAFRDGQQAKKQEEAQ